jgi:hypothetical protein
MHYSFGRDIFVIEDRAFVGEGCLLQQFIRALALFDVQVYQRQPAFAYSFLEPFENIHHLVFIFNFVDPLPNLPRGDFAALTGSIPQNIRNLHTNPSSRYCVRELRQVKHPTWSRGRTWLAQGFQVKSGGAYVGTRVVFLIRRELLKHVNQAASP